MSLRVVDVHVHLKGVEKLIDIIKSMDNANIDYLVLIAPYRQKFMPHGRISAPNIKSVKEGNDFVANLVNEFPDRLRGYAFITGTGDIKENIAELERAICDLGLHGVKMFPNLGWYPDDDRMYPLYERIEDLGIPILFHCGIAPWITDIYGNGPFLSKYSRPIYYEAIPRLFPKIKIILAHMGWPWYMEAITLAYLTPNVYLDICTEFTTATEDLKVEALRFALKTIGSERLLYASDATPLSWEFMKEHLNKTIQLLRRAGATNDDLRKILGENACKLFKI